MFLIERLRRPLIDAEPIPVEYLPAGYVSREEAEEAIQKLIGAYLQQGYDPKQDYWWARNTGDIENNIFVIRPV